MNCRVCKSNYLESLIDFGKQPIVHNLYKDNLQKESERYQFHLIHCQDCGFMGIEKPIDPNILYKNYFTISSWKNQPHVPRLVEVMESVFHNEKNDPILEIGCNDGSFFDYLKSKGYTNLYGIEPTLDASKIAKEKGYHVEHNFWNYNLAEKYNENGKFKLIITRQVLEHIVELEDFLRGIHLVLDDDGGLIIEIPDCEWNLDYLDYALWEEHVNYFTLESLKNVLSLNRFQIIHSETTLFSGRALIVYCEKRIGHSKNVTNSMLPKIKKYGDSFNPFRKLLINYLEQHNNISIYGCGARSSNFVNLLGVSEYIKLFIDDQKEKQNLMVPGCDLGIYDSNDIEEKTSHILFGVNTENEYKVVHRHKLNNKNISYHSILPPSKLLPIFWKEMIND